MNTQRDRLISAHRDRLRKQKIAYRNALAVPHRKICSDRILAQLRQLPEYTNAKNILLYRAVGGEVTLQVPNDPEKCFAFPRCISKTEMIALVPESNAVWQRGYGGIPEPIPGCSREIQPELLDMVVCPCTVFDRRCCRMGMGGGFYDRFLPACTHAVFVGVAFEGQKTVFLPTEVWDIPMDMVVTERRVYTRSRPLG